VLLTSVSYRGGAEEALHAGFSAFLLKPIRQSQLYDCIATVMGMSSEQAPRRLITSHTLGETPSRARVLVAEDSAVNQRLAARMLEKRGGYSEVGSARRRQTLLGGASQPVAVTRSGAVPTGITGNCGARLIDHYLFGAKLDTPWDPRL
jgi:PleD family two-component response regulator